MPIHRPAPLDPHDDRAPGLERSHLDIAWQRKRVVGRRDAGGARVDREESHLVVVQHILRRVGDGIDRVGIAYDHRIIAARAIGRRGGGREAIQAI